MALERMKFEQLFAEVQSRGPEDREEWQDRRDRELRQKIDLEGRARALEFARRHSHLGERFVERTFENYTMPPGDADALTVAKEIAEDPTQGGWFYGPFGNGKTHLVAAIVNDCIQQLIPATYTPLLQLLDALKRSYDKNERVREGEYDVIDALAKVPVLVLDDLDKADFTPWASQRIYVLVNSRYEKRLPLLVTSNASPAEISIAWSKKGVDGTIAGAIIDRMREMCKRVVKVSGTSQRGKDL